MSLIDNTYFTLDINLIDGTYGTVDESITRYEPKILRLLLGEALYQLVAEYSDESPQRIKDLVDGKEYEVDYGGVTATVKWNGLKNTQLISLIAYYVYYWYVRNNRTLMVGIGAVSPKGENADRGAVAFNLTGAWLNLVKLYGFFGQNIIEPSAYNFLTKYEDTYPEWIFTELGSVNSFDL